MKRLLLALLLLLAATGTVAAQNGSNASTMTATDTISPTPTPTASNVTYEADLYGDPAVKIRKWRYHAGSSTFFVTFESEVPRLVTFTFTSSAGGEGVSKGSIIKKPIPRGVSTVQVTISSGVVWISTPVSQSNGAFTQLEADTGSSLLAGPYDGSDVRDAGIGGALGVALAVLYEAVKAKTGANERGERLA
ncbi:hypothetical protein [Halorarius halobius]|uniref:hypothetical protein n=1 Tax=Halorarius halobius TaxID=2962671 RepID=UPI0020CF94B5|nr:hypothetical protein [Halorarius halobius]